MKKYLLALAFFALLFGCKQQEEEIAVREPLPVNAIVAKNEEVQRSIVSSVLLQGVRKATIHSQTMGEIVWDNTHLGKSVRRGEVLLTLENSVQAANLRQAAGIAEEAKLNHSASTSLFERNSISRAEFMRSQNNLLAAETALANAQKAFNDTRISAPFDGIITMKNDAVQRGNSISIGAPLWTIVDISKVKASISFGEKEIGQIRRGAPARAEVPAAGVELSGKITAVSSGSDNLTGTFSVEAEFENPDLSVKDGMSGVVSLYIGDIKHGISAPSNVLINNRSILLAKNGRAINTPVRFESISAGRIMLLSGVYENDTIIVSGITQLSGGDTISVNITPTQ